MRPVFSVSLVLFVLLVGSLPCARADVIGAGDPFVLRFDENGNGSISVNGGPFTADPGFAQIDPNTGRNALTYLLSGNIGAGIVGVTEPGTGLIEDAISFYNIGANGFMAYYSDASDGGGDLADIISGGFVPTSGFTVPEVGPEGNNGFTFFSGGAPGVNNDYFGISDAAAVPEPSSLALLSLGGIGLAGWRRWKGKRPQDNQAA